MNRALLEQRRLELAATVLVQRHQFRTDVAALVERVPRIGAGNLGRNMLAAAAVTFVIAVALFRPGVTARLTALAGAATIATRYWVFARLGWRVARPWLTRPPAASATQRSSP